MSTSPARESGARVASPCLCLTGVSQDLPSASTAASGATPTPCSRSTPGSLPSSIYSTKLDHPPTVEVPGTPKTPDDSLEVTRLENSLSSHGQSNQNLVSSPSITVTGIPTHVSSSVVDSASPGFRFFLSRSRGSIIRPEHRSASVLVPSNREQAKQIWREFRFRSQTMQP